MKDKISKTNNVQNVQIGKLGEKINNLDKSYQKLSSRFSSLKTHITNHLTTKLTEVSVDVGWIKKLMFVLIPIMAGVIVSLIWMALRFQ